MGFLELLHRLDVLRRVLHISIPQCRLKEQSRSFRHNCTEVVEVLIPCFLIPNTTTKVLPNHKSGILGSFFTQQAELCCDEIKWALRLSLSDPLQKLGIFFKSLQLVK
jgi:hypothetical protein